MARSATPTIERIESPVDEDVVNPDRPWITIVGNDRIDLMSDRPYGFQMLFGCSRHKAHKLMRDVHEKGRAVVSSGPREQMEIDVARLHAAGLWATLQQDD